MKKPISPLEKLTDFFDIYLTTIKGLSSNTITSYKYAFQLLFEYIYESSEIPPYKVTFDSLSNGTISSFLNWLETSRDCSVKTRNQRLGAIVSFAKFIAKDDAIYAARFCTEVLNLPKKKAPKDNVIKYFTKAETAFLLSLPDTSKKLGRRDAVLMSVLYASGARAQELCDMRMHDINFGVKTTLRLVGKGNKGRVVAIPEKCASLLKNYVNSLPVRHKLCNHVFSSQTHEHMTISCVEGIVAKYLNIAKSKNPKMFMHGKYSPHSFRHSIAVHMIECGTPLPVIKSFLGHASIDTTLRYATITPELANKYLIMRNTFPQSEDSLGDDSFCVKESLPFLNPPEAIVT